MAIACPVCGERVEDPAGDCPWCDAPLAATYHAFTLQLGYAEDTHFGVLFAKHDRGFATAKEAVDHLVEAVEAFMRSKQDPLECCRMAEGGWTYCPRCGRLVEDAHEVEPEEVGFFIRGLLTTTFDEASRTKLWDHLEGAGWTLTGPQDDAFKGDVVHVEALLRWIGSEGKGYLRATYPCGHAWSSRG